MLILLAVPALGGCALQAALLAADVAQDIPRAKGPSNAHLKPQATEACTRQAAPIWLGLYRRRPAARDRPADRLGIGNRHPQHRRTFECHFTTKIVGFKLREIIAAN